MNQPVKQITVFSKIAGVLVPIIFIITAVIINAAYRQSLFLLGVNQVYNMQKSASGFLNVIQNLFSLLGNPIIIVIVLALELILVKQRVRSLVHIIYIMGGLYFMAVLKQAYQQSRPFWYSDQVNINQWFCPTDFGNPSGHSFIVVLLYEPILSDFIGLGPKKILIGVWTVISALVLISRMFLGAHSLDQIVFGGLLGLAFLIMYKYKFQELLYFIIQDILAFRHRLFYAICNTVIFVIFLIIPIIIYQINNSNRIVSQSEINSINTKCNKSVTSQSLQSSILKATAMGFVSVGLIYGILMLPNKNRQDTFYFVGKWNFRSIKQMALWVVAILIVVGIPGAILALVIPFVSSVVILNYVSICVGATYASFALIYLISIIQNKYEWIIYEGNHQHE